MTTNSPSPGWVYRYTPSQHHCREGLAIAMPRTDEQSALIDTFWGSGGDAHVLTDEEAATAVPVFDTGDYRELSHAERGSFVEYHPDDRQVITSQHGLQERRFVRLGARRDGSTIVANARDKVREAEESVAAAQRRLEWARQDLAQAEQTWGAGVEA